MTTQNKTSRRAVTAGQTYIHLTFESRLYRLTKANYWRLLTDLADLGQEDTVASLDLGKYRAFDMGPPPVYGDLLTAEVAKNLLAQADDDEEEEAGDEDEDEEEDDDEEEEEDVDVSQAQSA